LRNHNAKLIPGGAAQNTARGAQYLLPADSTVYIGCVGKDKYAEILENATKKEGLKVLYRYDEKEPTGTCGVVITGHDRSLCTNLAAANCYKLDHLKSEEVWRYVEGAKAFYVGGYHLTVCPPAAMALGEEASKKNKVRLSSFGKNHRSKTWTCI
jgi:adenosine kinase